VALAITGLYLLHRDSSPRDGATGRTADGTAARKSGSTASASATPSPAAVIGITDVGDMNFGMAGQYPPGGPAELFAGVAGDLRSSLTVGNLETALGSSGTTKCAPRAKDCYAFQAPASFALAVRRAGFSVVNVANNHTDDAGATGITETDAALAAAHLRWTGRPGQTTYLVRRGVRIALLGFAPYAYDRDLLDIPAAVAAVRQAASRARLVIVFIHAGAEGAGAQHVRPGMETYLGEERGDPIAFSRAMVDAGADLVLGSGPHVLRAMQWYHGRLIAYSLGNFAGYYTLGLGGVTADSAILHVRLRANGTFAGGRVTPIRLVGAGSPEPDPARAGIALINSLSRSDLGASGVRLAPGGRIEPPRP
jgi:poly-gamma-glutamate capsule biosynthesis protein CapA/YwtB (metallophosphatase superfamily)